MVLNLYSLGNTRTAQLVWFLVAILCSIAFPFTTIPPAAGYGVFAAAMVGGAATTVGFFALGLKLRYSALMRERGRGYVIAIAANFVVSIIVGAVAVLRHVSVRAIGGQILFVVWLFCLFEICRPTADYGLLQFFLRLPAQCAFIGVCRDETMGLEMVYLTVILYCFCTCWSIFYLYTFERALEARRGGRIGDVEEAFGRLMDDLGNQQLVPRDGDGDEDDDAPNDDGN